MTATERRERALAVVARISTSLRLMLRMRKRPRLFLSPQMNVKRRLKPSVWPSLRSKRNTRRR